MELLKSLPEDRSSALLKRLREKGDPGTVVSESQEAGSEADSPSKSDYYAEYKQHQSSLEGELMANNPRVFPVLPPIDHVVLAKSNLLRPWLPESAWGQLYVSHGGSKPRATLPIPQFENLVKKITSSYQLSSSQ